MELLIPSKTSNFTSINRASISKDPTETIEPSLQQLIAQEPLDRRRSRSVLEQKGNIDHEVRELVQNSQRRFSKVSKRSVEFLEALLPGDNSRNIGSEKISSSNHVIRRGSKELALHTNKEPLDEIINFQDGQKKEIKQLDKMKSGINILKDEDSNCTQVKGNDLAEQCLLFIGKEARSQSVDSKPLKAPKPFQSFKELVAKASEAQQTLLKDLKEYDISQVTLTKSSTQSQLGIVKKLLEFNKKQQIRYDTQAQTEREKFMLPLIRRKTEEDIKKKKMPPVRVFPMRTILYPQSTMEDMITKSPSPVKQSIIVNTAVDEMTKETDISRSRSRSSFSYKFYWLARDRDTNQWRPEVREGHTLNSVGKRLVLYGGIANSNLPELAVYNTAIQKWTRPQVSGEPPYGGRHGHSACVYKRGVIIFGGQRQFNAVLNYRECLNDVRTFYPHKNEWEHLRPSGKIIEARRNHAAAIYDNNMYVYGGIDASGNYLRDVWAFSLKSYTWMEISVEEDKDPGVALHTMSSCFEHKPTKPYKEGQIHTRVPYEGIYVFGGKNEEGKILNTLKILNFSGRKPCWIYPITKGTPPSARYGHTMTVYEELGILIIYGGKNEDRLSQDNYSDVELFVLNLEMMTWTPTSSLGVYPITPRFRHAATMAGSSMMIFGGLEPGEYANDCLLIAEINQSEVRKLTETEKEEENTKKTKAPSPSKKNVGSILKEPSLKAKEEHNIAKEIFMNVQEDNENTQLLKKVMMSWLPLPMSGRMPRNTTVRKSKSVIKRMVTSLTDRGSCSNTKN